MKVSRRQPKAAGEMTSKYFCKYCKAEFNKSTDLATHVHWVHLTLSMQTRQKLRQAGLKTAKLRKEGLIPYPKSHILSPEIKMKISQKLKERYFTHTHPRGFKGHKHTLETRLKMSLNAKCPKTMPSKPERDLENILNTYYPRIFRYNGDFSLGITLGGLIPDFVNVNGKKEVIEVFGNYWHTGVKIRNWRGTELGRIMAYNSLGWKCLIIWESEFKNKEKVIGKIKDFLHT